MLHKLAFTAILAAGAVALGCSHDMGTTASAGLAPAGYGFHYLDEGASAKLAYGQANSDNVGLMLQCAKGSNLVEVSDLVRSSPASTLTLQSDGGRSDVKVDVFPGPGAAMAMGQAPSHSPALAGFRRSGAMEVSYAGLKYGMAVKASERPAVERFFSACETRA